MREANRNSNAEKFIRCIEMVQKRSIMYYQQSDSQSFLKIVVALPTMVASCRGRIVVYIFDYIDDFIIYIYVYAVFLVFIDLFLNLLLYV